MTARDIRNNCSRRRRQQTDFHSRSDCCDQLLNGGVQIEVWSSAGNLGRLFTNAYINQTLKPGYSERGYAELRICLAMATPQYREKGKVASILM